jgi:hypothetical protein
MARATTKTATKTSTKAAPAKKAAKKAEPKKTVKSASKKTAPSADDRIKRLEEKLSTLIIVLHHNFAKDLVKGPKDLARKIAKNGLLE